MMDVICAQCGEPWEYFGICVGDFEDHEILPFVKGESCPCCANHPERRTGAYEEQHWASLLEATDDPDAIIRVMPL